MTGNKGRNKNNNKKTSQSDGNSRAQDGEGSERPKAEAEACFSRTCVRAGVSSTYYTRGSIPCASCPSISFGMRETALWPSPRQRLIDAQRIPATFTSNYILFKCRSRLRTLVRLLGSFIVIVLLFLFSCKPENARQSQPLRQNRPPKENPLTQISRTELQCVSKEIFLWIRWTNFPEQFRCETLPHLLPAADKKRNNYARVAELIFRIPLSLLSFFTQARSFGASETATEIDVNRCASLTNLGD